MSFLHTRSIDDILVFNTPKLLLDINIAKDSNIFNSSFLDILQQAVFDMKQLEFVKNAKNLLESITNYYDNIKKISDEKDELNKDIQMNYNKVDLVNVVKNTFIDVLVNIIIDYSYTGEYICCIFNKYKYIYDDTKYINIVDNKIIINNVFTHNTIDTIEYKINKTLSYSEKFNYINNDNIYTFQVDYNTGIIYYNRINIKSQQIKNKILNYRNEYYVLRNINNIFIYNNKMYIYRNNKRSNRHIIEELDIKTNTYNRKIITTCISNGIYYHFFKDNNLYICETYNIGDMLENKKLRISVYNLSDNIKRVNEYNIDCTISHISRFIDINKIKSYLTRIFMSNYKQNMFIIYRIVYKKNIIKYFVAIVDICKKIVISCIQINNLLLPGISTIIQLDYNSILNCYFCISNVCGTITYHRFMYYVR